MSDTTNIRRAPVVLALAALCAGAPAALQAQEPPHAAHHAQVTPYGIPASIRAEHQEIHEALEAATRAPGRVGAAARELAAVLHPHFQREEQIALPPLALLAPLARGETSPAMRAVLPLTDSLRAELPRMLREHEAIHTATARLGEVARAEGDSAVAQLADKLALHAQEEEELLYPAAVLVGDLVRARVPRD
ncbi:MAG TPA: hemerythrin domain-containing protein [Gemmatimonadaceae bacterium]